MKTEKLLTLICPVFNVEKYISELILSLVQGVNSDRVTVVFVNDASTDQTRVIATNLLCKLKKNIKFRYEWIDLARNCGVANARNVGVKSVKTPYISFVDSDDMVDKSYFSVIEPTLDEGKYDLIEFGYREFIEAGSARCDNSNVTAYDVEIDSPLRKGCFSWCRVYSISLVSDVAFPPNCLYEDVYFSLVVFSRAKKMVGLNAELIHYRRRPGSITSQRDARYSDLIMNLTNGFLAGIAHNPDFASISDQICLKVFVSILKGFRIRPISELRTFLNRSYSHISFFQSSCNDVLFSGHLLSRAYLLACEVVLSFRLIRPVKV